jgi:hypothetical protein
VGGLLVGLHGSLVAVYLVEHKTVGIVALLDYV